MFQTVEETTDRKCLSCQENFQSTWIGNRMCEKCKGFRNNPTAGRLVTTHLNETGTRIKSLHVPS